MGFFNSSNENRIINGLQQVQKNDELFKAITILQNEVSVGFDTKVIAVCGVNGDKLATVFAKALADAYSRNDSSCLLIDANLYNPCLSELIGKQQVGSFMAFRDARIKNYSNMSYIDKNINAICMDKEIYPSNVYKSGVIQKIIKDEEKNYEHFIVIVPSVKDHKEIFLLSDVVQSIIMVTQKNVTIKKHIFEAIQFFKENKLPLAKTVVLK